MLGFDQVPESKTVTFNANGMTAQQKKADLWMCGAILTLVGLPSLAVALVSTAFNAMFAYSLGATHYERVAWVLASLGFSLFVIGLPIARPLIRERRKDLDNKALYLWLACLGFSITSALGFSFSTRDHSASVAETNIKSRKHNETEIERLQREFNTLPSHRPTGNIEASIDRVLASNVALARDTNNCKRIQTRRDQNACAKVLALREELSAAQAADRLETKIEGISATVSATPATSSVSDPQAEVLDWMSGNRVGQDVMRKLLSIFVALLVEAGSAIGLSVAAEAFVAVLRERSQPAPAPEQAPSINLNALPLPANDTGLGAEGSFAEWAARCVSFNTNSRVRAQDAFGHYETWCAQNGASALQYLVFGRRMSDFIGRNGGQIKQSDGRVYEGVRLVETVQPQSCSEALTMLKKLFSASASVDPDRGVAFLENFLPGQAWVLAGIGARKPEVRTFVPQTMARCAPSSPSSSAMAANFV